MSEPVEGDATASESYDQVTELVEQQAAISDVLRAIANSPHDLQPIFDTILDAATRLCRADLGSLRLIEEGGLRRVAVWGDPILVSQAWSSYPILEDESFLNRLAPGSSPTHIPDLRLLEGARRDEFLITKLNAGLRTGLIVRLLQDNRTIGIISLGRKKVQPFTDTQISLFSGFASLATIALESTRRERNYRETLHNIIETVPAFLWSAGPDGEPSHISQRVLDYSGMRLEDFKRGGWETFLHPADFPETVKAFEHAIRTGTSYEAVHRLRRAEDGEYRWFHARGEPLLDRQGNIIHWYGLSVDIDEKKKAEDQLRRSEAYLAEAQRLSHIGVSAYNDTAILYGSEETFRIWGFDPAKGIPNREAVFERIHPDDRAQLATIVQRAVSEKRDYTAAYRIVLPDGTIKHLETIGRPAFSASGELTEIVTTQIDVTERKIAQERLRRSEAYLAEAQRLSHTGTAVYDDTNVVYWTEEASLIFGFDPTLGIPSREAIWQRLHPDDVNRVNEDIERGVREKRRFKNEFRVLLPDGTVKHVEAVNNPVFSQSGTLLETVVTGVDVTERKRGEQALRNSEQSLRSAIDGIAGMVLVLAPDGEFETVNRQVLEYFGRPLEWITSWKTNDAVHPDDFPRVAEVFGKAMVSGIPYQVDTRLLGTDGNYRWFEARGVPIRDDSGRIARWYVLLTDIEDRTRALARLDQMQSDLAHMNRLSTMGELAASLAHEIAQPIATARNNARAALNFADRGAAELDQLKEALAAVVDDADRAGEILRRIRDHIKKAPPRKERVDLNHAISDVLALAQGAVVRNRVSVQTSLAQTLPHVWADRIQVQQVVLNLILNAVEAMGLVEKGVRELAITTEHQEMGGVIVAVRDSGPGIDLEQLERVFDAFYTTKSDGVGIGLSICRSIIDAHGGRLWADRNNPRGAVFFFTLPAE